MRSERVRIDDRARERHRSFSLIDVLLSVSPLTETGGGTTLTDAVACAVDPPASNGVVLVKATSGGGGWCRGRVREVGRRHGDVGG